MAYQGGVQNLSRQPSQQSLSHPGQRRRPQDDGHHGYRQDTSQGYHREPNPQQSPYMSRHDSQRSQSQHNVYPPQGGQIGRHDSRQDPRQPPSQHQSQPSLYPSHHPGGPERPSQHPGVPERSSHHPGGPEPQSPYLSHRDPGQYGSQQIADPHQSPYPSRHELRRGESNQSLVRGSRQNLSNERQFTAGPSDHYSTVQKPHRDQAPNQRAFHVNHHESHQTMPAHSSQPYQPHSTYPHHQSQTSLSLDARSPGAERGRDPSYPSHQQGPANQQMRQDSEAPPPYFSRGHSPESSYVSQPDLSPPPPDMAPSQPFHSQPAYLGSQQGLAPSYIGSQQGLAPSYLGSQQGLAPSHLGSEQGQAPSEGQYSPAQAESQHIAAHLARNESSRTQQSVRSHHSRASSLSNTPPIPEVRGREASHIVDLLQREIVYITGGRDRSGGPVVTFPGHLPHPEPSQHDIMTCLQYYVQIPSEESKCRGFTAVVDSRDGSWPNMVTVLGCLKKMLGEYIKQVFVIKSDPNIDRKSVSQSFRRDKNSPNLEPQFMSVNRLYQFVDKKELTGMFGGHLSYHHGVWLKNRQDLEKFIRESRAAASHLDTAEAQIQQAYSKKDSSSPLESLRQHRFFQDSIMSVPTQVIRDGRELLSQLRRHRDPPQGQDKDSVWTLDDLEAQKQVKRLIQYIEQRVEKLQNYLENRDRTLSLNLQYEDLQRDIKTVVGWILGPGEKLLSSQVDIGDSYETANELRRRLEEMEIKCMDTYGQYAELRHKAEELMEEDHPGRDDIHSIRDYMDTVCRSFASRLERRRTLLITSVRFHRLAEDFSQKLDNLLELLCTEMDVVDVDTAEKALTELNEKCDSIDLAATQSLADGQSLLDEMSRPIKNASGKDISPDYDTHIKHINKCLEDLQERKMRCDDLADVRKLKLQQLLQLRTCERDADQAIAWIRELCEVMVYTHTSMGHTPQEAEGLQEEHKKFESTAEGTYDYGKQLIQAAFVLRKSQRIDLAPNEARLVQLEDAWKRFSEGTNERANRLTVAAMFLSSAEKIFEQLENLMVPVSRALAGEITAHEVMRHHTASKEQMENEYNDANHMGRALLERLSLPILLVDRDDKQVSIDDQGASEGIVGKLRKLDRQVQELSQGWEEMQQVRRPPQPPQRSSSQRSQTLPRSNSGSMRSNDKLPKKSESLRRRPRQWTSEVDSRSGPSISEGRVQDQNQGRKEVKEKMQKLSNAPQESTISRSYAAPVKSQPVHQRSKSTMPARPGVRTRQGDRLYRDLEEGAEWIRVRVHQMEPDLMDVGSTIEEALQYQREHNEMLAKLKAKEDEVKKILCSADSYVTENPSQADVYSAMADTLSEAWRELNKKLEARSLILEQSVEFHKSAHEFSSKMEQAQGKFSTSVPTHDVETARHLLQQHQEIKTGILEASKSTLNQGHILLTRIREMGMHADLQNRHATTAACYGIEHLLELLQDRRRRLEDIWEQRRIRLEQCFQLCQLDMEVNKVLDWYRTVGSTYLQKSELGESYHQVQLLQEDHNRFETQAKHIQQTVVRLVRDADQLLRRANMDAEGVRRRLQTVDRECEDFRNKLDTRRKNIQMAASFFDQAETALTKLDQVEVQLNSMDLPRNSAALADGHAQLSNAIVEVSTQALREGRILLERVSRDDPGADGVRRRMTLLQERCASLESLCKARRAEAWERSQAYLQFQEHFNSLQTWLTSIGQATLSQHADMGTRLETAEDFLEIHEQLEQDLRDKNAELEALFEAGVSLVKSGDQEAQTAAGKVDTLHKQMQRLHRIVEVRIQLSLVYLSFHKLVQQLSTSMSGLEHIMTSETENLQDLTDQAMRHTEEMYTKLSELYTEVQEKGKTFFQNTSTVTDDSTLNVKDSVLTVERTITEYSERMTYIKTVWESWQQKVSTSRQFKSQWHQFVQDARKTIDWVLKIENDFFPVVGGDLGTSIETANEFQHRLDEFTPTFESAIEELDKHLSTAELMEMKGDTKGQKDMIVNELVKVRQRFQARIHEYRILIKMTIQFFRNLDQLDKLIEKTEKEYTQSELPSDLSQAECMLEEHKRKQKEVSSLINFTSGEGEKIVVRVRQTDAEAAAQEDVERVLNVTAEYKQRWNQAWEDQEKRLKQNLQICQFNYDLRQIHSEIDDLHHHLQARRGSYGNSLPAARMTSQAFKQFEMTVQLIEKKISMFTSTAQVMVQDQHYDAVHIGREIDLLKTKWSTFHTSVGNYRMLLDVSITYFTLIEESEQWIREGNTLLINISRRTPECRNPEEVETLARSLNTFMETGKPRQEDRLKHISELAVELYGDEGPTKVHHLFVSNQDLMSSAQQMDSEIAKLHENLTKAQMAPVQEDVVPMEVTVTASAAVAKQPPRITLHLKDAEVMEGEKVTLQCQVQSQLPPEVTWFKDNLPLNSPDYETKFDLGCATLTIEETFSEDTARYTCRFTNEVGVAESSSYLHVRALEKPIIHSMSEDVNIPEGKSVKLEIIFSGSPTPEVTWYRNDDRISPSSVYKITIELNRSVLEITEAYTEDSGTYKVTLQNTAGETHRSCQVNVENFYSSAAEEMSIASLEAEPQKPSFVQPLAPAREVMEGSRVRLDCVITGHPEPEVIWFRKDKPVKESKDIQLLFEGDRCTLSIREAYLEDSGHYRCVARNQHGEAESVCKLHVEPLSELSDASCGEVAAPKFTQLLRDLSIPIGHRVCLQCRVTGHPVPDIHWYKDNKLIENSPDYQVTAFADVHNLTIPETFEEDTGNYMVRATNLVGEAKCYAKLSVKAPTQQIQEAEVMRIRRVVETKESNMIVKRDDGLEQSPPEFQKLFQDMTVNAGDNVTFQCEITGSPKPKVTWYFNGEAVVSRDYQISMEKNTYRLHIPEVFDEDAGRFSITAENPSGKATCSACLNVDEEPTIPKTRIFGNTEMLSKRVSRTETTMTETHVKHIFESTQPDTYIPSYESHSTTILTDVSDAEPVPKVGATEHYATTIKTDMPPTFKPVDLTIAVPIPPQFLQPLKNITAAEGSKVVFEGVVSGKPEPTIKWFREGKQLTDKADFEIGYRDGRVSLTIPEVFEEDAGRFECQADNEGGQATSSSQLLVRATMIPPMFTEKLKIMETREGKAVRFTVRVSGQPPPTVTWYREGTQIVSSRDFEIITEGDLHTLYIPEVFQEDGGNFTVTAENPAGHAQCTTELRILAPMDQAPAPVQPVTEVRETFDQRRAPPREAPKPFEPTEEPSAKVPKLQRPSQFVARPEPKPKMFSEQVEVQVQSKPPALAPVEMRIPLFKAPQQEDVPPPLPASKPPTFVTTKEKPIFTQMLKNVSVCEGERVVFECRISAHPEPIIKWFRETVVISSSPDYEITWENNTARLTIAEIFPEDAGVFKCVATNAEGSATSEARLQVKPASTEPSVPISEEPVQQSMAPKRDEKLPTAAIPPQFTDKPGNSRLVEATNTIFECHVTGVPFPEITWKKRGFPIRTGTRHRMTVDTLSGRCSLTISHCRPDDSGEYTCTAVNPAGQDTVTATLLPAEVKAPSPPPPPIPSIPVAPLKSWQPVSAEPRETYVPVQEPVTRKPWEPVQVQKQQPVSAPQKTWEPPMSELRARMEAPQRHPQEFVVTRAEKILESNLQYRQSKEPEEKRPPPAHEFQSVGFEQRLMSENYMRDGHIKISSETETSEYESELPDDRGPPAPPASPAIIQKLKDFRLIEGSDATFVCRVTGRPRPKIAWYKNGHRIKRSNRYEMKYTKDGYCTLRIRIALPEDAGHFTILAVNASGKATCSSMLYVDSVGQIDSTSFVAPTTLEKMASKDKLRSQKPEDQSGILEALVRPTFKKVPESLQAREGQTVRLDTVVSGRPAPELTWYRDGQPVRNDNNHKTVVNEDGVNSLIILSATRYDAGTYMCVAKSKAGENSFNVIVSILEKEMLQPPKFINRMPNVTAKSGEPITLSCQVAGTPTPMISWQKDGKMLVPSNPYRIDIEGNRSTLYIEHCEPADSAWFQCSAINVAGSATTRAKVHVPAEMPKPEPVRKFTVPKVSAPPQVAPKPSQVVPKVAPQEQAKAPARMPGSQSPPVEDHDSAVREYIRREGEAPASEDIYDKSKPKKPWFKTQIKNLMNLKENDSAHFECKLLPLGDPTMEVEWYKDGQPLHHGHRYKPMHDFGFVCLDILYTYPEDSGEYSCIARNSQGEATSSAVLRCRGRRSIIMDTQLPGEGAMRLQEMEEYWRSNMYLEERILEEPRERIPPSIDLKPEPVETGEGEVAKFMIKVSGYPRPRVNWWVNGTVIMGSTRFKLRYDGMIHHLEIPRVREYDGGQIRVVAKNTEGEAEASTTLHVVPKEDWRSRLRQAPKAAEKRVVMRQEKEVMNAEQLYMSVHSKPTMRELPARVVRADRPEIQVDIQKARMVPVIPEPNVPDESKISETQIVLERREPPVFTKPLRPVRVTEGNPITLEVHFKGYPPPIISWYRDSFEIKPSHDFQISVSETVSTLFIPEVFPEDTGMYMVKAYNMYGTVQCKAKMTVIEEESPERDVPPEFRSLIRDSNVLQGEPATFDCQVSGRPKPKIHWQKDGKTLSESPRWKFIEEDNNFTMVIYEVTPEDVGQYDCVAINTVGKATCTARLNVEVPIKPQETEEQTMAEAPVEPPVVTEKPQNLEVDEGEPVTFTSRITGSPAPNVTWYRNNVIIKPSKYFRMESTPDGTHSLSILEAFPEDTGNYRCVARNKAGEVTCSATLKVHALESEAEAPVPAQKDSPPSFTKPISNTLVVEGSPATFEAEYSGTPEPNITWLRNSLQVLQDSTNYKIERTSTKTILTIREARPEDSGLITCRIKNIAGITECSAELYVQEMTVQVDEVEKVIPVAEETVETVEGLPTIQEKEAPETTETISLEIAVGDERPTETEEVSFEIVTREKAEATPEEVTTESIVALPDQQEVPLTAAVQEVSEAVTTETQIEIGVETQPEEAAPEEVTVKELPLPKEEVPVVETAPEVVEEVTEEEAAPTKPTGEAPRFTTELSSITVTESSPVKFICIVIGIPTPKVTWLLDGEVIEDSETYITEYQQDGTCTLSIDESFKEDEGEYSCQAVNDFGTAITTAELKLTAPEEKLEESVAEVTIEQVTKVEETKEEIAAELTIEEVLSEKEKLVTAEEEKDAVSEEEKSPAPDEIKKPESPELVTAEIVEERTAPEIVQQLVDVVSKDGGSARFECIVEGLPRPEVTWYKDEEQLATCEEFTISYEENTTTLEIPDVYVEDGGKYTVVAKNELGTAMTTAELIVEAPAEEIITGIPPYFDKKPKFQNVESGVNVHFEAVVRALPQPDIIWTREGAAITTSDKYTVETGPHTEENTYHTSLTLNQVTLADAGTYKISASNEEGDANVSVSLLVRDEGPKTTDFRDSLKKEVKTKVGVRHAPAQKDFRDNLKTEVKTKVGVSHAAEQIDFRDNLKTQVRTKEGTSFGAEQLDFRDNLKTKVKTKVGTSFQAEQVDYRDTLQNQVKTKVGESFATEQVDYRDALQNRVQTKVGTSFEMEQVDYRDALQRQVETKVGTVFTSEQVDYRDALQREVTTKVGVTYESEQVDYRDALQTKVTTKVGTLGYQAEQIDFRDVLQRPTLEEPQEVKTAEQVDFRDVLREVEELVAPRFDTMIESVVAKEGEPAKFFVKVTGKPTPEISWHHDDQVLTTDEIYKVTVSEEGESTLELPEVFPEDTGKYTVKAVNTAGEAVATATLTVTEEMVQEETLSTTEVITQEVQETVESKQVVSVQETVETTEVVKTQVDASADIITEEQVSEIEKVEDLVAPSVTVEINKMAAKEGEPVQFIAKATGFPAPTLQWYYGTEPINTDEIYKVTETTEGESTLDLAEVFPEDAGEYTIKAVNEAGEAVATTTLNVIEFTEDTDTAAEVSVEVVSEESSHAFPDTQYEVGTKVFTWHLRSEDDTGHLTTTTLLKEEVEVVDGDEEFYEPEESVPQFSFEAKVDSDEESEEMGPAAQTEYTFSSDYSIDSQIVQDKEPEEEFTFVLKEDVPETSPEKDIDETDEFTFVTKDDIPKLDLPQSSSDEEEEVKIARPLLDNVSLSSSEEYLSDEEVVVSSASSDSEPEQRKVSMPDVVPQQKEPIKVYPTSSSSSTSEEEEDDEVKDQTYDASVYVEEKLKPDSVPVEKAMVPVDEPFMSSFEIVSKDVYMARHGITEPDDVTFEAKLEDKDVEQPFTSTAEEAVFTLKAHEDDEPAAPHVDHDVRLEAEDEPREDVVHQMYMDKKSDDEDYLEEYSLSAPQDKREEVILEEKQPDVSTEVLLEQDEEVDGRPQFSFEAEVQEDRLDDEDIAEVSYEIEVSEPRESDVSYDDQPLVMTVETEVSLPSDISSEGFEEDGELYEEIEEFQGPTVSVLETVPEESSLEESQSADVTPEVDQDVSFSFSLDEVPKDDIQETFSISEVKTVESVEVEVTIPRFMRELSDQEVTEGDTVTFIVEVLGSPFPDISWFKDGVEITPDDHFQMEVRGNFASLIVKDVVTNDDAEYVVKATNEAGSASSTGELFVNPSGEAPTFVVRLEDQTIELGEPLKLECQVKGHPKPRLTWLKDGEEITDERYTIEFIEETATLQIATSVVDDEGDYSVKAVNDRGAATCNAEVLVNLEAPKFTKPLSNVSVDIEHTAVLECTVVGKPTPKVTWLANQTIIEESVKYHTSFHDNVATLEITSITEEDGDVVYTCKAENVAGDTSCTAQITVQGIFV